MLDDIDVGAVVSLLAGGAGGIAVASAPFGSPDLDYPAGPAARPGRRLVGDLSEIDDLQVVGTELQKRDWLLEFHMPDQDPHYPSAISLSRDTGRVTEVTIRMGPLGDQAQVSDEVWNDLAGRWADVAMTAASTADVLDVFPEARPAFNSGPFDLGDRWVADEVRPHVRLRRRSDEPYDMTADELAEFIEALASAFDREFGTLEERVVEPEFADFFM